MTKYPFQIGTVDNAAMKCVDLTIQVGGFKDKKEAQDFARVVVKFLEDNANAWAARAQ